MGKIVSRSILFISLIAAYAWCTDNVVITGTVTDSASGTAIKGMRITSQPSFMGGTNLIETFSDATGKYSLNNIGTLAGSAVNAYLISTSYPNAYQYKSATIQVPASAIRSDGNPDTIIVNIPLASRTPPPDTLFIKGTVLDTLLHPMANAKVKCAFKVNTILFPKPEVTYDTLRFTAGNDGVFSYRGLNIYAIKAGNFMAYDAIQKMNITKTSVMKDSGSVNLFDGKTDSISVGSMYLSPTGIVNHYQNKPVQTIHSSTPVSVSIFSVDGRLVRKINNLKIEAIDRTLASMNIYGGKVLFAVWNQNGAKCSKRLMNMTKIKN